MVCELGLERFDDPRAARATARAVHSEVRRLVRSDRRLATARLRRRGREAAELTVEVEARSSWHAAQVATEVLESALRAAGQPPASASATWAEISAEARRRALPRRPLPPLSDLVPMAPVPAVIDLR